jgi:adenylyltransferase/sulfurtransferase
MNKLKIKQIIDPEDNPFDRQERIAWWSQDKLRQAKVMVVGAGAIGNETLKNLALLGVGNIFIVDFDTISTSNLSRTVLFRKNDKEQKKAEVAAQRTREMSLLEDVRIDWLHGDIVWDLGTGVYREMDIVLGCLDNIETRFHVNRQCWLVNTPWIDAGILELGLRVNFYESPKPPCYQCTKTSEQLQAVRKRYSCDNFKKELISEGKMPTVQIASAMVSAIQVQEAIKYLCGQKVMAGKQVYYQGTQNDFDLMEVRAKAECQAENTCCYLGSYPKVESLPASSEMSLREFLNLISQEQYAGAGAVLDFRGDNRSFVVSVNCKSCQKPITLMRPSFRIFDQETYCQNSEACSERVNENNHQEVEAVKTTYEEFDLNSTPEALLDLSLYALGIPDFHIVSVKDIQGNYYYYELSNDKAKVLPDLCQAVAEITK